MPLLGPNGAPIVPPTPEQIAAPADETLPPEPMACVTAFVVYQLPTGQWQVADDLNVPLVPDRKPNGDDFTAACAVVERDVRTQEIAIAAANLIIPNTANAVVQAQMNLGKQVAEQRQAQMLAQQLEADKRTGRR